MSDSQNDNEKLTINVHVPPELEYNYRDITNVFVGQGDVVIEFGNFHRSMAGSATIYNRIVLSVPSAYTLMESLNNALTEAQDRIQQELDKQSV